MAVNGNELWLEWNGGVNSSVHESKIGENELADGENFISRDGTLRLDQRYELSCELQDDSITCQGAGWGKYEDASEYVVVLGNKVYRVDLTQAVLSYIENTAAGEVADGDWFFTQFEDKIYAANETAGIARKTIGELDWLGVRKPRRPTQDPLATFYTPTYLEADFTGSTITNSGLSSANFTSDRVVCYSTTAGTKSVSITLDTSPDLSMDLEYRDVLEIRVVRTNGAGVPKVFVENALNDEYELMFWYGFDGGRNPDSNYGYYRLHNIGRLSRSPITGFRVEWTAQAGDTYVYVYEPKLYGVWLSLPTNYNPGSNLPVFQNLYWFYAYYNSTLGLEGPLSLPRILGATAQNPLGNWANVNVYATGEDGVDKIRLYRGVPDGDTLTYYLLDELSNASQTYVDKLPIDEVEALPTRKAADTPRAADMIATWQNRLVVATGALVQISRSDDELAFEDLDSVADEFDPGRGLTFYPDDRKAETIYGLAAADTLFIATDFSVRALFGTEPGNWRLVKLFDEGCVGKRAWCAYGDGIIILTPTGRLMYLRLGASPEEISKSVKPRIGNDGIRALSSADAQVAVRPDGQIEVRDGEGAYYVLDWEGAWRKGTLTHPSHSLLYVPGLPIRWVGTNGKLYEGGDDSFTTDAGTEVEWWALGKQYLLPRSKVTNIYLGAATEVYNQQNTMLYPKVELITSRRSKERTKAQGRRNIGASVLDSGWDLQVKITGNKDTVVPECRLTLDGLAPGRQL